MPTIRATDDGPGDVAALWRALAYAAHTDEEPGGPVADARDVPALRHYVEGWGRPGDLGVVAEDEDGGVVGAAWLRLPTPAGRALPEYVDDRTPEMAIAVLPGHQGRGIGAALLCGLVARARGRYPAIILTVRAGNPARRLYERHGFVAVRPIVNRVGTVSQLMRLDLAGR